MNKRLLAYLRSLGLAADATTEQSWEMFQGLRGMHRTLANLLNYIEGDEQARTACDLAIRAQGYNHENPSEMLPTDSNISQRSQPEVRAGDEQVRAAAAQAERSRIARITDLAEVSRVPAEMRQAAIDGGHTVEVAQETFLRHYRETNRAEVPSGGFGQAPAGHAAASQTAYDRNSLIAAMMLREGVSDPTRHWPACDEITGAVRTRSAEGDAEVGRAVDRGNQLRGLSMIEIARRALAVDGIQCEPTASAIAHAVRSNLAASKLTLTGVFSTSYSAVMVGAYEEAPDSTQGWTNERMVPNYLTNERTSLVTMEGLAKRAKGKEADHTTLSDAQETYKVSEYARQFVIDEQDLINDAFGALEEYSPLMLGRAAARLRPDLVYAILLANAAMRDSVALFHASHGNLNTSAALAIATLAAAVADMRKQQESSVNLNLMAKYLIVPADLQATAWALANSTLVVGSTSQANLNPNSMSNLTVVSDARLDNGVVDPNTGTSHAGSASTWFMSAAGEGRTIEVGYIRELGRNPRVRTKILDEGRFGISFDVQHSVGAKAIDWRGLHKNTA